MVIPDDLRETIAGLPISPGVYIYRNDEGRELYVGKAKSLRRRVRQYFDPKRADAKTAELVKEIRVIEHIACSSETEAYLLENRLIKDFQPKFNVFAKSDISFPYVEITWDEEYPRVRVTRDRSRQGGKFYGPFIRASWLRVALVNLQRAFPFRTCNLNIQENDPRNRHQRPCLEYHLHRCRAPCAGKQKSEDYRADLRRLVQFLGGKSKETVAELRRDMAQASAERRYEDAAALRDALFAIESLSKRGGPGSKNSDLEPGALHIDPREGVAELQKLLELAHPPQRIEGVDIAHLHGDETVGSVVCFLDGLPARGDYRRYRIHTAEGGDDFAAVGEVVFRRCRRALAEQRALPDILLIDGGIGQLHAAEKAVQRAFAQSQNFEATGENDDFAAGERREPSVAPLEPLPPLLLSLSKQEERVHSLAQPEGLKIFRRSSALRLLQFVRDEAHRFARHYHHILRRKRVLEEE